MDLSVFPDAGRVVAYLVAYALLVGAALLVLTDGRRSKTSPGTLWLTAAATWLVSAALFTGAVSGLGIAIGMSSARLSLMMLLVLGLPIFTATAIIHRQRELPAVVSKARQLALPVAGYLATLPLGFLIGSRI
jgi:heme A synthase